MFGVILAAVRTRTAQALTVLTLAVLAGAAAAAAPWYGLAATSRAADAEIAAAPGSSQVLTVNQPGAFSADPRSALDTYAAGVRSLLRVNQGTAVLGLSQEMVYLAPASAGGAASGMAAAYRDGVCAHLRITGRCPAVGSDAVVSQDAARQLKVSVGATVALRVSPSAPPVAFRVVGLYRIDDPTSAYWGNKLFGPNGELDPLFTPLETFTDPRLTTPRFSFDLPVPRPLLRGDGGGDLNGVLNAAQDRFHAAQMDLVNPVGKLLDRIRSDRLTIQRGVFIALAQVLVLAWFTIGLTARHTGRDRRGDAALLKLRGTRRAGILRLTVGQHVYPLIAGGIVGIPIGALAARPLAGAFPVRAELLLALGGAAAAVAAMIVGGLLVLLLIDAVALRQPVVTLLRTVPPGRRDWRSDVLDLLLVLLAAGAVYQARSSRPDSGLGLVAPALVALAVALLLARLLGVLADRAGGVALRGGHLRWGLTAVRASRQPGTDRVLALLVVAVAVVTTTFGVVAGGRTQRADRAEVELGAARVLTVAATNATALEYAVRQADPAGRSAMAVVVDRSGGPPVLGVDSSRLAAVARWRPEYGSVAALPAAVAGAELPPPLPRITGHALALTVRNDRPVAAGMALFVQNDATGATVRTDFTGFPPGRRATVSRPIAGCTTAPGCRVVRVQLFTPAGSDGEPVRGRVTLESLAQQGPPATILDPRTLTDVTRWHTDATGNALQIAAGPDGLEASTVFAAGSTPGDTLYAVDAPLPVPVVLAGPAPIDWYFQDATSARFGPSATPVRVVARPGVLPVLGSAGMLVDLDAVRHPAPDAEAGRAYQVWLAPNAPDSVVDALRGRGLTVVRDYSIAARTSQLGAQADVIGARFGVLTVLIGLLIAAAAVGITTAVDRDPQAAQLRALRNQGLPLPVATGTVYIGTFALIAAGLLGGLLAAAAARPVAGVVVPPFPDGWRLVAAPGALGAPAVLVAAAVALLVIGVTGWFAVLPLIRRLRAGRVGQLPPGRLRPGRVRRLRAGRG